MMISSTQASMPAAAKPTSSTPQLVADQETTQLEDSTKVTISSQARQKTSQAEESQADEVAGSPYRLTGAATLVSSLNPFVYKMPDALMQEMELRANEEAARNAVNARYANEHPYQTVGQVLVDGKLVAEVNDAGGYGSIQNAIPALTEASLNPQERLEEIAQALKGKGNVEIRYADFLPGLGGSGGAGAPESMLPPFTARSIHEIFAEATEAAKRLRSSSQPASESSSL